MKKININSKDVSSNNEKNFSLDAPEKCPHCNMNIQPKVLSSFFLDDSYLQTIHTSFMCPNCNRFFTVEYCLDNLIAPNTTLEILPHPSNATSFSQNISELSPNFVKIYNQAEKAENIELDEICGQGYRKSLEFLVKDYAIKLNSANADDIKNKSLSQCIRDHISDSHIQTLATASAWIGNDETHYVRKHNDYDINHLKSFISTMINYIELKPTIVQAEELISSR